MNSRERVLNSLEHKDFDRLPIKHLADNSIDEKLCTYFGINKMDELLDMLGHDFREIRPIYHGPGANDLKSEHGIIPGMVWGYMLHLQKPDKCYSLGDIQESSELDELTFPTADLFDYTTLKDQCIKYGNFARILGYCELDLINGISLVRGQEQTLIDIVTGDPVFLKLVEKKYQFTYDFLDRGLKSAEGLIDIVHLGEDLGTQGGLMISPGCFREIFAEKYRSIISLIHRYGAKAMMHSCGSVRKMIPDLIDVGLDILDVVQTNAVDMDLDELKREFGNKLALAGTMCVQSVLPYGTKEQVKEETQKRLKLFENGGLIFGPSHQIQDGTPVENIIEMYRCAGGLAI